MKLKIYSFIRTLNPERFDYHYIRHIIEHLKLKNYDVEWLDLDGNDKFVYKNGGDVVINQGSITIFEFEDGTFKTYDFGDAPTLTLQLSKSRNFIGAAIGQYNKKLWDETILDINLRSKVKAGIYPESFWQFGVNNYNDVQAFRDSIKLDSRLFWRGSIYENPAQPEYKCRESIKILSSILNHDFYFGYGQLPFDSYMAESMNFKLALCYGVGGGYICGDHCLRDIELYGIGIPTIRPIYAVENFSKLIPNEHYIAVDLPFDNKFRYEIAQTCAEKVAARYKEVILDSDYLKYVANNARKWYIENISYPVVIDNIIKSLDL